MSIVPSVLDEKSNLDLMQQIKGEKKQSKRGQSLFPVDSKKCNFLHHPQYIANP